ncbi:MAG: 2-amino-4-hydroxy-6-hydroxymethyldihydropteridine diphosphokinase [Corynebacteriales bacterium]|nr:2-amino-4-hydroxy-6-hydroxymethyldihydropteridine diphosphokinase [Mycobacteriales bacterium]
MTRAVLALGGNMGDAARFLRAARAALDDRIVAASSMYRTPPWGPVAQDDYVNAVFIVRDDRPDPSQWLALVRELENAAGRERTVRWGPRTLDVDVIAVFDDAGVPMLSATAELTVPHPRAFERAFVLVPWLEVDAGAVLPGHGAVAELVAALPAGERAEVRKLDLQW